MTDTAPPLAFEWTDEGVMKPLNPKRADAFYAVGERYIMEPVNHRSEASHRHEFGWLRDAWMSLPEGLADLYPTTEHLRKRALIEAGYYDESVTDCSTNAAALRVAGAFRAIDDFSLVIVRGPLVVRRTAKSQSRRAMKKDEFQASKTAIMEVIAGMIGVPVRDMVHAEAA